MAPGPDAPEHMYKVVVVYWGPVQGWYVVARILLASFGTNGKQQHEQILANHVKAMSGHPVHGVVDIYRSM